MARYRIRPCNGNKDAWLLTTLRDDGSEVDVCQRTSYSVDALMKLEEFTPADHIEIVPREPAPYTIAPARYAKGMMAVHVRSDGSGWKTRAHRLAGYFARDRYSGREHAYILSRAAAAKFEEHFKAGFDGGFVERKLTPPSRAPALETGSTVCS